MLHKAIRKIRGDRKDREVEHGSLQYFLSLPPDLVRSEYPTVHKQINNLCMHKDKFPPYYF